MVMLLHVEGDLAPSIDKTGGTGMMPFFAFSSLKNIKPWSTDTVPGFSRFIGRPPEKNRDVL